MRGLSPEQVLLLADECCAALGETIRDYAALVSISALSNARIHTVEVFGSAQEMQRYIAHHIIKLAPLSGNNQAFAALVCAVLEEHFRK